MLRRGHVVILDKYVNFDSLGENLQSKSNNKTKRLFLIISNNINNTCASPIVNILALSTKVKKRRLPMHAFIDKNKYDFLEEDNIVLAEQVLTVNKSKISKVIGQLNDDDMQEVDKIINIQFACNC